MNFCSRCGNSVIRKIPDGDDRERFVCENCDTIHYQNPRIVAGCLVTHGDRVLLCRRAIEPRYGYWTLPAGFMENGETLEECASRETWEEAQAKVELHGLYTIFSLPYINQVYQLFRGKLLEETFATGPESLEVALFSEDEIPWDELAFPVMGITLRHFFADRKQNSYPVRSEAMTKPHYFDLSANKNLESKLDQGNG